MDKEGVRNDPLYNRFFIPQLQMERYRKSMTYDSPLRAALKVITRDTQ